MTTSAEIRWFFKGIINNDILVFFKDKQIVFQEEKPRTDCYLLNNDKFTSIKLRSGSFEVKRLVSSTENYQINPEIKGNAEKWVKFVFSLQENEEAQRIINGDYAQWVKVDKKRSLVRYEISGNEKLIPVSSEDHPAEGCSIEICFVKVMLLDFWTLCFESSGTENTIQRNLDIVTRHIFGNSSPISLLKTENSFNYPQLLSKVSML